MNTGVVPVRVQRKRTKGFRLQDASPNGLPVVYVGRPTKWGNAFLVGVLCPPRLAVINFRNMLNRHDHAEIRATLRGKNLCCWCRLDQPCHADVLLELANAEPVPTSPRPPSQTS